MAHASWSHDQGIHAAGWRRTGLDKGLHTNELLDAIDGGSVAEDAGPESDSESRGTGSKVWAAQILGESGSHQVTRRAMTEGLD